MDDSELIEICQSGNADKFQKFLDEMDLEDKGKYIESVRYSEKQETVRFINYSDGSVRNYLSLARTTAFIKAHFLIPETQSRVTIFPKLLDKIVKMNMNLGDLFSVVVDHEGTHAKDIYESPRIMSPLGGFANLARGEIRAFREQERNFQRRDCSKGFIDEIIKLKIIEELRLYNLT